MRYSSAGVHGKANSPQFSRLLAAVKLLTLISTPSGQKKEMMHHTFNNSMRLTVALDAGGAEVVWWDDRLCIKRVSPLSVCSRLAYHTADRA